AVLRIFEIIQEALPPGVANVISGFGEEAGKPLCEHPLVRKITFTGSSVVGAQIMHYAADKFISVTRSMQFIDQIQAGFVQVNQFSVAEASVEYGGTKISGIGRELSLESMPEHFTWSKTIIINYGTPRI